MQIKGGRSKKQVIWSKLAVLGWMGVIFWLSAQNGETSGALSQGILTWVVDKLQGVLSPIWQAISGASIDQEVLHTGLRKLAHFCAYMILSGLVYLDLQVAPIGLMRSLKRHTLAQWLYTLAICGLYAVSDELHQAFVPGRGPSVMDVGIDTLGAASTLAIITGFKAMLAIHQKPRNFTMSFDKNR